MICVSLSHISQLDTVILSGVDLVELRLDLIKEEPSVIYSLIPGEIRTIATLRPDGTSQDKRIAKLKECIDLGASYIDLELESSPDYLEKLLDHARRYGCEPIISYHNFDSTPGREELNSILRQCYDLGGHVAKIATLVNSDNDVRNLISLYEIPERKVILGMGVLGRITRVVGPYLGAEFTFASPGIGGETAPGQLSVQQLNEIYNVIDKP